jgi:uncharacterized protein YcfJ
MRFMFTLIAKLLTTPEAGLAQMATPEDASVNVGSRVRVAAPVFGTKAKQVGTVVSMAPDTVVLRLGPTIPTRSLAISDITSVEVARGTHTRKAQGALWGTLLGAGAGGILGYALYEEPRCSNDTFFGCINLTIGPTSKGSNATVSAVAGGLVGALVGTLVGNRKTDTWVPVTIAGR